MELKRNNPTGVEPSRQSKVVELSEIRKKNGAVYTPSNLANYVAEKVVEFFFESSVIRGGPVCHANMPNSSCLDKIKIIDPACGDGELLVAAWNAFQRHLSKIHRNSLDSYIPDAKQVLCGLDIDQKAIRKTRRRITSLSRTVSKTNSFNLVKTNALYPFHKKSSSQGWEIVKHRFQATDGFDILIANPPWGAEIESYKDRLSNGDFSLYKGQYDTSDLFVELALSIVKPGGYFAFIVPDSLFNKERAELRSKLLEETEIKYIGRFGEKIFKNINRACAVLICRKYKPTPLTSVDCLRLTAPLRRRILQGELTFRDAEKLLVHRVRQSRFANNRDYLFDIYLKEVEQETLEVFNGSQAMLRDYLSNGRGVELSKSGEVCKCTHCGMWLPYPRNRNPKCPHCRSTFFLSNVEQLAIISSEYLKGYEPILVGENVKRYQVTPPYWIATDKIGINYKDRSLYEGPKILVRKTGVGLLAAIDYENSLANQVVYIFRPRPVIQGSLPLELFLAILNSRAIYYYLVKSHGETEWRSHPYLTQEQILDLPLPKADLMTSWGMEATRQIVELLRSYLKKGEGLPPEIDAKVEYLVANLYGLSRNDYERIYETLEDVEELVPIKALKTISICDIFGL